MLFSDNKNHENIITNIILNKFKIYKFDEYKRIIPNAQYIVIEFHYYCYSYEYTEWDMNVNIVGYLDQDLNQHDTNTIKTSNC